MIKEKGDVNADVLIEFLRWLVVGASNKIFLIVDCGPAHVPKKARRSSPASTKSSTLSLPLNPEIVRSIFYKPSLKYAA
jgi:hypothetical protein